MRRAFTILVCSVIMNGCSTHAAPVPATKAQTYWLPRQARSFDVVCVEPGEFGERWPLRCRTMGEVRDYLGALKAN